MYELLKEPRGSRHGIANHHFFSTAQELVRTSKEGGDGVTSGVWPFHLLSQFVAG
jgi:hypothetical protein